MDVGVVLSLSLASCGIDIADTRIWSPLSTRPRARRAVKSPWLARRNRRERVVSSYFREGLTVRTPFDSKMLLTLDTVVGVFAVELPESHSVFTGDRLVSLRAFDATTFARSIVSLNPRFAFSAKLLSSASFIFLTSDPAVCRPPRAFPAFNRFLETFWRFKSQFDRELAIPRCSRSMSMAERRVLRPRKSSSSSPSSSASPSPSDWKPVHMRGVGMSLRRSSGLMSWGSCMGISSPIRISTLLSNNQSSPSRAFSIEPTNFSAPLLNPSSSSKQSSQIGSRKTLCSTCRMEH